MRELSELARTAASQLAVWPVITGKEKAKRLIREKVLRQKLAPLDHFSWPNALLAQGLLTAFAATGEKESLLAVAEHLKRWKSAGFPIHYVDNLMNGTLALWIEALLNGDMRPFGGVGESSALGGGMSAAERQELLALCQEAQEKCASWARSAARTPGGLLAYRSQHPEWLFADTLGMLCPFACGYGLKTGDEALLSLGLRQLQEFSQKGMDAVTGLPYHGYDEKTGMKYGIIGWGRACGWMLKGLAESLLWFDAGDERTAALWAAFEALERAVSAYQRPDGGFSWQLEALEGHRDTSAEGMIGAAAALGRAATLAFNEAGAALEADSGQRALSLERLAKGMQGSFSAGRLTDCSGECKGFAEYPQVYGSYPWGTGSALQFLAQRQLRTVD